MKSRANNLIVLVEFLLKFTSNSGFQLFLDVLSNFAPFKNIARIELSFKIVCARISFFSIISTFFKSRKRTMQMFFV